MALTGRTALLAALGSLPVGILAPSWTGMLAVNAPLSLAILCDYALAAPVRTLRFTRSGDTSVRLGDAAEVQLTVTNTSRRRLRAQLRDAWPPAAGPRVPNDALPATPWRSPPGSGDVWSPFCARPVAANGRRKASRSARTARWASPHAKGSTGHRGPYGSCRRSPAASICLPGSPGSGNSTAAPAF